MNQTMKDMGKRLSAALAAFVISFAAAAESPAGESGIRPDGTYMFAQRDTCELFMDVYEPAAGSETTLNGKEKPTIIFMFGGGFISGQRDLPFYFPWYGKLTGNGYRVVAIDYRLGLKGHTRVGIAQVNAIDKAIHLAVEDLFSATRFLIDNADALGINPDNIVISGSSAGAITVLQADYELSNRTGCTSVLPEDFRYAGVMSFSGGILSREGLPDYARTPAPTLMLHGTEDRIVNYTKIQFFNLGFFGSDKLADRFAKFGYNYNIIRYEGCGHEIAGLMNDTCAYQFAFLETNVMGGKRYIVDMTVEDPSIERSGTVSRKELFGGE